MRSFVLTLTACGAAFAMGCSASDSEPTSVPDPASNTTRPLILDGSLSPEEHSHTVLLLDVVRGNKCSGVVIAPNLVLTARHCVSDEDEVRGPALCPIGTEGEMTEVYRYLPPRSPGNFVVRKDFKTKPSPAIGLKVLVPDAEQDPCGKDIAAVVFHDRIGDQAIAELGNRLPNMDEVLTGVGLGIVDNEGHEAPTRLERDDMRVTAVGPMFLKIGLAYVGIPLGEFATTAGLCNGDSGGPILDADGKVLGIAARGGPCESGPSIYTSIQRNWDFIQQALVEADDVLNPKPDAGAKPDASRDAATDAATASKGSSGGDSGCAVAPGGASVPAGGMGAAAASFMAALLARVARRRTPR